MATYLDQSLLKARQGRGANPLRQDQPSPEDVDNVEFFKAEIEHIPLTDNSVDVVTSNCAINFSADKGRVLKGPFRVLKPGGRFDVFDVVTRGEMLPEIRERVILWVGCIAGALRGERLPRDAHGCGI